MASLSTVARAVALALALLALTPAAKAQEMPVARVAILDYQQILRASAAAIDIKNQIDARRKKYQEEITAKEQQLRNADAELARQRTILAPDAFAARRSEFEARVAQVQQEVQARKRELDQAYNVGIKTVQRAVAQIVTELARERGFNLVLERSQIIFASKTLNISDEVQRRLDERLPKVEVPLPGN